MSSVSCVECFPDSPDPFGVATKLCRRRSAASPSVQRWPPREGLEQRHSSAGSALLDLLDSRLRRRSRCELHRRSRRAGAQPICGDNKIICPVSVRLHSDGLNRRHLARLLTDEEPPAECVQVPVPLPRRGLQGDCEHVELSKAIRARLVVVAVNAGARLRGSRIGALRLFQHARLRHMRSAAGRDGSSTDRGD